jgi:tyrosyl-tRNA synthetase
MSTIEMPAPSGLLAHYSGPREIISQIGKDLAEIMVEADLVESKTAARKQIKNGGVKIADIRITDPHARLAINGDTWIILEANIKL